MIVLKRDYPFGSFIDPFTTLSRKQPAKLPLWCAVFTKRLFTKPTEPLRIGKEFAKAQSGRWMEVCDLSTLYLFFVFVFVCFCFFKKDIWRILMILYLEHVVFQHFHIFSYIFSSFMYRYFMIFLHPPTLRCCPRATSGCRSSGGISWADDTRSTGVPGEPRRKQLHIC